MSEKDISKAAGTQVVLVIPDTESLGQLDQMENDFSLTMKYKTADDWAALKDQPIRAFFMGIKEVPSEEGEMVTCGIFVTKTELFLSGQMVLIEAVKKLDSKTPIEIIYRGKKSNKSTEGSTMLFDVTTLK